MTFPEPSDERAFLKGTLPENLLESAIFWISQNVDPSDVFPKDVLESWAEENGYTNKDE